MRVVVDHVRSLIGESQAEARTLKELLDDVGWATLMTSGYPAQCPTVRRGDQAIGFCPSPNGCYVRAWWAHDGSPLGAYPTVELAVAAALAALGGEDPTWDDRDPAEIAREVTRIATVLHEVDWSALGW